MSKYDTALSGAIGIAPTVTPSVSIQPAKSPAPVPMVMPTVDQDDDSVFDEAESNITTLIDKGVEAFEDLVEIAKSEESPRAFEVLNSMLGTLSDLSLRLVEVQERKLKLKKLKKEVEGPAVEDAPSTVNNTMVFMGTSDDLQEMIRKRLGKE